MGLELISSGYAKQNTGEDYLKRKLVALYAEDESDAILYIQPKLERKVADFILIDRKRGIAILEVKDWGTEFISKVDPLDVTISNGEKRQNPTNQLTNYFNLLKGLLHKYKLFTNSEGKLAINMVAKACMVNLTKEEIEKDYQSFFATYPAELLGKDELRKLTISDLFNNKYSYISEREMNKVRGILFPEIKILDHDTCPSKNHYIEEKVKVLDLEQERFAKRIAEGHYMLTGIPGSGKTVILMSRALFLAKEHPEWNILILTYNKSLTAKLKNRLNLLKEDIGAENLANITIQNFHKFSTDVVGYKNLVSVKKDEDYWNFGLANIALETLNKTQRSPMYDALFIDEYQDFDESWFKLGLAVLKKYNEKENLFLAGDRLQSIYNRKDVSWKSLGINIQGRSKLLKTSYRTGRKHIHVALAFLENDSALSKEIQYFYEGAQDIQTKEYGENIIFLNEDNREIHSAVENLLEHGYLPKDILILVPDKITGLNLMNSFKPSIKNIAKFGKDIEENVMMITTYHSAKGLESKICILAHLDKINDRKLAYVGMTRASEHLYIQASDYNSDNFATEIRTISDRY